MTTSFRKFIYAVLIAALAITALPLTSVFAARVTDTATPPAPGTPKQPARQNVRLELAFARQQYNLQRTGLNVSNSTAFFEQVQALLDKARENGKDASAVQTAFNAYKVAFDKGKPLYEQAKTIAATHAGFDSNGIVTDPEKAKTTIKSLNDALKQYRDNLADSFKTLREAIQAFRKANPLPGATPIAP
jgi:hypothetical protein